MTGQLLAQAKRRIDAGEAGEGTTWPQWLADNIGRSEDKARELIEFAEREVSALVEHAATLFDAVFWNRFVDLVAQENVKRSQGGGDAA